MNDNSPSWYSNSLYDELFMEDLVKSAFGDPKTVDSLLSWFKNFYKPDVFGQVNESQLENAFVRPLTDWLGWTSLPQVGISKQDETIKPDWALFTGTDAYDEFIVDQKGDHPRFDLITVLLEVKTYGVDLNKRMGEETRSPHTQLIRYLDMVRKRYGFLTNGRYWRFYDQDKISRGAAFVEIDLEAVLALTDDQEQRAAATLFYRLFGRDNYVKSGVQAVTTMETLAQESELARTQAEEDLKAVIYGTNGKDSIFQMIGRTLYRRTGERDAGKIYDNAIILLFRLLFIICFEDKNRDILARHKHYNRDIGLDHVREALNRPGAVDNEFDGFSDLRNLFEALDKGKPGKDMPAFNGGLFNPDRAPLVDQSDKTFSNGELRIILDRLLYKIITDKNGEENERRRRDYKNMSVIHLGRIYEGLLEFSFETAREKLVYLTYQSALGGPTQESYLDAYDAAETLGRLEKSKGSKWLKEKVKTEEIEAGDFYLRGSGGSRKSSASYYTPTELSEFMVQEAIDGALQSGKTLMDLKIIDNACGSGHFLVEALNYLAYKGVTEPASVTEAQVASEKAKIADQLREYHLEEAMPDDERVLKRILLKQCIYGVDLNPFAVELARLSLWIDSFVFGTPLSFIEHHVKRGNALMGATVAELKDLRRELNQDVDLFSEHLRNDLSYLKEIGNDLSALQDTTKKDIDQSKAIYKDLKPKMDALALELSAVSALAMMEAEDALKRDAKPNAKQRSDLRTSRIKDFFNHDATTMLTAVKSYQERHGFFHYEVEFPETHGKFDVVIGNPPWDKTKFADDDFFPYYQSDYRSLKNNDKTKVRNRVLQLAGVQERYDARKQEIELTNEYYMRRFPLNKGAGDGNLFRFFVENNLRLLKPGASLTYVLPSALMLEEGSQTLRRHILTTHTVPFFYSFENRDSVFTDVHRSYKFAMIQMVNTPPPSDHIIKTAFYLTKVAQIGPGTVISYPVTTLRALSPEHGAMMELHNGADLALLQRCYDAFPSFSPAWLTFGRELDMTNDRDLFIETYQPGLLPLGQGATIWQYSCRHSKAQYWVDQTALEERLKSKELYRMKKATTLESEEALTYDYDYIRLAFRDIASDTNERTLIAALLPKNCPLGNSLNVCRPKLYIKNPAGGVGVEVVSPLRMLFCLAWFNSLPTDWLMRFVAQIHMNITYIYRLPMPQPTDDEILANPCYATLARNALLLTLADDWESFAQLAPLFNLTPADLPKSEKALDKLRFNNDTLVAQCYALSDDDLRHILRSFPVMTKKRPGYAAFFA